jgi:hypothetical protein
MSDAIMIPMIAGHLEDVNETLHNGGKTQDFRTCNTTSACNYSNSRMFEVRFGCRQRYSSKLAFGRMVPWPGERINFVGVGRLEGKRYAKS